MSPSLFDLSRRLLINGIRFRYLKWTGRPVKPQALSLEITHHGAPELDQQKWKDKRPA